MGGGLEGSGNCNADYGAKDLAKEDITWLCEGGGDGVVFEDGRSAEGGDDDESGCLGAGAGGWDGEDVEEEANEGDTGEGADEGPYVDDEASYRQLGRIPVT